MFRTMIAATLLSFICVGCKMRSEHNSQLRSNASAEKNSVSKMGQDAFKLRINNVADAKKLFDILPSIDNNLSQFDAADKQFRVWCGREENLSGCEFTSEFDGIAKSLTALSEERQITQAYWQEKNVLNISLSKKDAEAFYDEWDGNETNSHGVLLKYFRSSDSLFSISCSKTNNDHDCVFSINVEEAL